MAARRPFVLVFATIFASMGASYRTPNFIVEAQTAEIAQQVGQYAEYYRKEKARLWLGQEMAPWPQPCPIRVTVTMRNPGGATNFVYEQGQVLGQDMHIEGPLDRLLNSVLPHEVTHTVFAYYFHQPVPRWADEGGAVLSEDDQERNHHEMLVREILRTPGRAIPLGRLFVMTQYPHDVMCLYAQGYSVSNFLVEQSSRPAFLKFIAYGMRYGWDNAVRAHYPYNGVNELEQAWLNSLKNPPRPAAQLTAASSPTDADPASRIVVRLTVPPAQPLSDAPGVTYRGQMGEPESDGWSQPRGASWNRPGPDPTYPPPSPPPGSADRWQPSAGQSAPPGRVLLGPPQALPGAFPSSGMPGPGQSPPGGYPYPH